jgi:predicted MPP superfamily phosphohydrolase
MQHLRHDHARTWQEQVLSGLLWSASVIGLSSLGLAVYAIAIEPRRPQVVREDVYLKSLPPAFDGYTIAQVSDFHLPTSLGIEYFEQVEDRINDLLPDCIVLTGDFLDIPGISKFSMIPPAIRDLRARDGVYAVLGNHDYKFNIKGIIDALQSTGVCVLINEHVELQREGADGVETLYLAGVDNITKKRQDLNATLRGIPDESSIVLLAHEPDYADEVAADGRVDLQLSGHTHGGQIRVPFYGAVKSVLPALARIYVMGRYQVGEKLQLYVNRGIGIAALPIRFNCPPEITLITLRRGEAPTPGKEYPYT